MRLAVSDFYTAEVLYAFSLLTSITNWRVGLRLLLTQTEVTRIASLPPFICVSVFPHDI